MATESRVALVAGATGLVGREVLAILLADERYCRVHALTRRPLDFSHPKLEAHVVDFARLPKLPLVDEVFIALGTTIKVAGSQEAFRAVDYDAVVAVARAGIASKATKLGAVSALGAHPKSSVFYSRVKGEAELALELCGYPSLVLARPAMLAGDREALGQPGRSGERIGLALTRALRPLIPSNYQSIDARDVAAALVKAVQKARPGVWRLESGEMQGAAPRR
ncbi:nucleoside-diphosphate sugar epimerase [Curvibacter sp. APW13]|uniref:nucleoside-diphosphate sugar epimerase n=1 Tax=Curvibacter sp. APW13 TaxID=3077236 RepID=UPI0028DDC6AB|nr:nucleoside-diphosphate sugar epimerase [Curvibacter sp. APW13]MDT8991860.1 nucleoside-diphosphate sugar epimerase [Curvibacter sp. APW13]